MFKEKIYLHHKVIIYLNLFPVIFKIIAIILSFKDDCNKVNKDDYSYIYNFNYTSNNFSKCLSRDELDTFNKNITEYNLTVGLKNYYVNNTFLVPIGIFVYIILITVRSYTNSSMKWLMDLKYISEKKLLMIYGLMGAIISSIICIITTYFKCKDIDIDNDNKKDIYDYICKVKYNDTLYFDNFNAFPKTFQDKDRLIIIFNLYKLKQKVTI